MEKAGGDPIEPLKLEVVRILPGQRRQRQIAGGRVIAAIDVQHEGSALAFHGILAAPDHGIKERLGGGRILTAAQDDGAQKEGLEMIRVGQEKSADGLVGLEDPVKLEVCRHVGNEGNFVRGEFVARAEEGD